MAENIRNHHDRVVDLSPMGCQTGFYLSVLNDDDKAGIEDVMEKTLNDVLKATEVPACNEVQCGWGANHSIKAAQQAAHTMLNHRDHWKQVVA